MSTLLKNIVQNISGDFSGNLTAGKDIVSAIVEVQMLQYLVILLFPRVGNVGSNMIVTGNINSMSNLTVSGIMATW
jgi:hypothetical protein